MSFVLMTAADAALEFPRINEAIGCLDCEVISRRPEPLTRRCPRCRSASVYDITKAGPDGRISAQHLAMISKLDSVLTDA